MEWRASCPQYIGNHEPRSDVIQVRAADAWQLGHDASRGSEVSHQESPVGTTGFHPQDILLQRREFDLRITQNRFVCKTATPWVLALILLTPCVTSAQTKALNHKVVWKPGEYKGLVVGKSTLTDARRVFGKEIWQGSQPDGCSRTRIHTLQLGGNDSDTVEITAQRNTITGISIQLKTPLSRDEAVSRFGKHFQITRYATDECKGCGGSAPLCVSPKGDTEVMEYPSHGFFLWPDSYGGLTSVEYTSKPASSAKCSCKGKN